MALDGAREEGDMPEDITEQSDPEQEEPAKQGRTWTDEEHDAYVKARIDKQAKRYAEAKAALDARIAELETANKEAGEKLAAFEAAAARAAAVEAVASETGLPASVVANLKGDDAEALKAAAEAVRASVQLYPAAPAGAAAGPMRTPSMTRAEIADIKDPAKRLEAIRSNLGAYQ